MSSVYIYQNGPVQGSAFRQNESANAAPENKYSTSTNGSLATELLNNFDYFEDPSQKVISQARLREVAGRPMTGNPVDDNMTLLAREILNRPSMNRMMAPITFANPSGDQISRKDVAGVIEGPQKDEKPRNTSSRGSSWGANNSVGNAHRGLMNSPTNTFMAPQMAPQIGPFMPSEGRAPNSVIAQDFADNFSYFQDPRTGFVSQASIIDAANRPLTGDPFQDKMIFLAREILSRPEMNHLLDAINNNGLEDGYISQGDANRVVDHYERGEGTFNGFSPRQGYQQQPSYGVPNYQQQPSYGEVGGYGPSQAGGMSPQDAQLANDFGSASDSDLALELGNNFDYFNPNANDKITQASLREVAGRPLTGNPVDDRMTLLAREIISRPAFNRKLDSVEDSDKPDRIIGRDTVETLSKQ